VKRSRYHCACCFCVVCSVCSSFRLPGLRELRVCSVCYRDNMLRWENVLHRGIHTQTVAFSTGTSGDGDCGNETWEVVELDRSLASSPSSSVLQIAMHPAPYTVLTGVLFAQQQSMLFAAWKVRVRCCGRQNVHQLSRPLSCSQAARISHIRSDLCCWPFIVYSIHHCRCRRDSCVISSILCSVSWHIFLQ
jgi:hypothetical protein